MLEWKFCSLSLQGESNVWQRIEQVELFVAALEQLKVGHGYDLWDLGLLKVWDFEGRLSCVEVEQLMQELLAVVAFIN